MGLPIPVLPSHTQAAILPPEQRFFMLMHRYSGTPVAAVAAQLLRHAAPRLQRLRVVTRRYVVEHRVPVLREGRSRERLGQDV